MPLLKKCSVACRAKRFFVFFEREIQNTLGGLGLCLCMQRSLSTLDLGWVQLKVFTGSLDRNPH